MHAFLSLCLLALCGLAHAQQRRENTTPVPILRQLNRHNEDGSYSYGYEGADGSFKIETKYPNGEVYGKYGYVDPNGERREIEYGATKRGFEPVGSGVTVPPPTLGNNNNNVDDDGDDGQYREDPDKYWKNTEHASSSRPAATPQHAATFTSFSQPQQQQQYRAPAPAPQPQYHAPQQQYYQPQQYHAPAPVHGLPKQDPNQFYGHPATNFDIHSGSYTINYSG